MAEIVTEGAGWVERAGEQAELDVNLHVRAPTRAEAVQALGARARVFDETVVARAVRKREIAVHDDWSKEQELTGCIAMESARLVVTEPAEVNHVVATLLAAEASVMGPRWRLANPSALVREAQRLAVAEARERAEGYAAALGLTLGPLTKLSESTGWGQETAHSLSLGGRPDVHPLRLDPEPVRVTVRCTTTWEAG